MCFLGAVGFELFCVFPFKIIIGLLGITIDCVSTYDFVLVP